MNIGKHNNRNVNVVFVYGALRSGTTLLRLMLDEHELLNNPGEADYLFDYINESENYSKGWQYNLDELTSNRIFKSQRISLPENLNGLDLMFNILDQLNKRNQGTLILNVHRNAQKIRSILPEVRFIHLVRDPRDVARSSIGMGWAGTLYHGVRHWIETEADWDIILEGLQQNQYLELHYESLIVNPEESLSSICNFLGVKYSREMLDYDKRSTYDSPNTFLVEQWRRLSKPRETSLVEGRARALLLSRGYEACGAGRTPSYLELIWLVSKNKFVLWRFGINRYGVQNFIFEKVTRWLSLKDWHQMVSARMQEIDARYLK